MLKKCTNLRRIFSVFFILIILSSCKNGDTEAPLVSDEPPVQTAEPAEPSEDEKPPPKTVIVYARGMDETDATLKLIEEYNKQSEKVYVRYQELPYSQEQRYNQIYMSLESGNSEYDIIDLELSYNAEFASKGYSLDLTPYVERDGIDWEEYLPAAAEAVYFNDRPYAMPKYVSPGMLYLRTDAVSNTPDNWDQLISMSQQLKGVGGTKYGYVFGGRISEPFIVTVLEFVYSYGGRLMDSKGNVAVNLSETVTALEKFKEIYKSDFVPEDLLYKSNDDACVSFLEGESLFMRNLPYAWALGNKSGSDIIGKFAIAPLPKGDAGSVTLLSGYATMISASTAHPEEAWDFVKYMSGHEGQAISAIYGGRIPVVLSVLDDKSVLEKNPHFANPMFRNLLTAAQPRPITPYYSNLVEILKESLYNFLEGSMSAEDLVHDFVNKMSAVIIRG